MASNARITDGSWNFAGGVDSGKVSTIQSALNPNGLNRNQLAWLSNATVRGGAILQRTGFQKLCEVHPGNALYQGGFLYDNSAQAGNPYLMLSIGGEIYQVRVDTDNSVVNLSTEQGFANPADADQSFFVQAEEFLVTQAGDGSTLPLFWDGYLLRRSIGMNTLLGVTNVDFTSPAMYPAGFAFVEIELDADGWKGQTNQRFYIEGDTSKEYMHILRTNHSGMANAYGAPAGTVVPAGSKILHDTTGAVLSTTLLDFTVSSGPTVAVYVSQALTLGSAVRVNGMRLSVSSGPLPAIAADHIYAVNINDTAGILYADPISLRTIPELPAATCMDYYMGRIWYAQDRTYTAGDIVGGDSGTAGTRKRDSVLKITENPLALAGDGFTVPTSAGNIRALKHSANLDTALGQGQLFAFTRKVVYSLNVPVTRAEWVNSKEPLQRVAQKGGGAYGDRCIPNVNGDLFYQAVDGIRSLLVAIRNFGQWGNTPISRNINRLLAFNDRSLMRFASGIEFDNRMLQTALPYQTEAGVAFRGIAALDFDLVSSLGEKLPPAWEGMLSGVDVLQLFEGDFGGLQRAFAVVRSTANGSIQVWELDPSSRRDDSDNRVEWYLETPAFTWGKEFELKTLDGAEIWIDRVYGQIDLDVYYRPDADACWQLWTSTAFCSARTTCEDVNNPICYPEQGYAPYGENYKFPVTLPTPPAPSCQTANERPANIGYQFQLKIVVKGWARIRGIMVHAIPTQKGPFEGMAC